MKDRSGKPAAGALQVARGGADGKEVPKNEKGGRNLPPSATVVYVLKYIEAAAPVKSKLSAAVTSGFGVNQALTLGDDDGTELQSGTLGLVLWLPDVFGW